MTAMPAPALAPRMSGIHASPASILRRRARELRAAGRDIIELSSGNPDFATPDHVIAAAHAAARRGETRYTDVDGTPELKQAVRAALLRDHRLSYAPDEIVICNGSTQALFNALLATLAPGDEVIVPAPYWAPYLDQVRLAGGTPVIVPCPQNNGFKLHPDDLRAAITPRTRWLIVNNPVNPSGAITPRNNCLHSPRYCCSIRRYGSWPMASTNIWCSTAFARRRSPKSNLV
jgi:aspartate aminotransferase